MAQIILRDVIVKHNIPVSSKYGTIHIIIFYNPKDYTTWYWKTSTTDGLKYEEHCTYSIMGIDEGDFRLSRVSEVSISERKDVESEQKQNAKESTVNALDILLPTNNIDTHLTNDEKYDILKLNLKMKGVRK